MLKLIHIGAVTVALSASPHADRVLLQAPSALGAAVAARQIHWPRIEVALGMLDCGTRGAGTCPDGTARLVAWLGAPAVLGYPVGMNVSLCSSISIA